MPAPFSGIFARELNPNGTSNPIDHPRPRARLHAARPVFVAVPVIFPPFNLKFGVSVDRRTVVCDSDSLLHFLQHRTPRA